MLRRLVAIGFFLAVAVRANATGFSGPWNGTIAGTIQCYSSGTATQSYKLLITLTESNGSLTGSGTMAGKSDSCYATSPVLTDPVTLTGSISGSVATGTISTPHVSGHFKATVVGSVLSFVGSFGIMDVSGSLIPGLTPVAPAALTGTWSGKYTSVSACSGHPVSSSGAVHFSAIESSGSFSGAILVNVALFDCTPGSAIPIALPFSGTTIGNTFTGMLAAPFAGNESGVITGSITGDSMDVNVSIGDTNAHATLSLSSSEAPATDLAGSYAGGHISSFQPCGTQPAVTYAGSLSSSLTQIGASVFGTITSTGNKTANTTAGGGCQVVDAPPETDIVSARVSGTSIAGVLIVPHPAGETIPFIASINGDTISGAVRGSTVTTFIMTRAGSTPPPPRIRSFTATPKIMKAGDTAMLSWSTLDAASVTIDHDIGAVVGSGTLAMTPSTSTVYTLTASSAGGTVTAKTFVEVLTGPVVNVHGLPHAMLQLAGTGGASTSYTLRNSGGTATAITLAQTGDFFTQSPSAFTLAPGAAQTVTITAIARPAGAFEGTSDPSGNGVPATLHIRIKLLSAAPPSGNVTAEPEANRVDVSGESGTSPTGSIRFRNRGSVRLVGILNSEEPWLVPQAGSVTIDPGQTATFTFSVDRTQRPDAAKLAGSVAGSVRLSFFRGGGASFAKQPADSTTTIPSVSLVKVVDTVKPTTSVGGIPTLGADEVGLLIPGVGHTIGKSGALFVSDVSILNALGGDPVDDVKLYYTPASGNPSAAQSTSLPGLEGQATVAIADVVKNVFNGNDEVGTLHIRSKDAAKLAVAATVLSNGTANGTYGNAIPVFRTDRATAAGDALVLTALHKDATTHTNLYVQETSGAVATVQIQFLGADGNAIGSRPPDTIQPFRLLQLVDVVPQNAVAAVIANTSTGGGKIAAYATPVDDASGDTWAITDWSAQLGYTPAETAIVPVAGNVHGANSTFYRTDVAITNRGTAPASGTLRYIARTGEQFEHDIALGPKQSAVLSDVVGTAFGVTGDTTGYLMFMPDAGAFALASRTFTTVGSNPGTFGTGVPAVGFSSALHTGDARPIAGLDDAARSTVVDGTPGTFRTNFALMETAGAPVTVRVTFRFTFPAGQKAQGSGSAYRDYDLNPNAFLLLNSIASEILGAARLTFGDLTNVEADFQVMSGSGAAVLFTSSVDNATGDSILRTE